MISIKMIFSSENGSKFSRTKDSDPLVVPIAMPMIAGPAALATLLVLAKTNSTHISSLFLSLILAWFLSSLLFQLVYIRFSKIKD